MNDVQSIFLRGIEEGCLSVYILLLQVEALLEKQFETFEFAISADVEEDGLLVVIFEVGVGSVVDEEFHDFVGLLVVDEDGWEVECGLTGLGLEAVDEDTVVLGQEAFDLFDAAGWGEEYQHFMAIANSFTIS